MIDLLKEWWFHLQNPLKYSDFWDCLTYEMEAADWRSPWGMMESARFAAEYVIRYEGRTEKELYELFCDEEKYIAFLDAND